MQGLRSWKLLLEIQNDGELIRPGAKALVVGGNLLRFICEVEKLGEFRDVRRRWLTECIARAVCAEHDIPSSVRNWNGCQGLWLRAHCERLTLTRRGFKCSTIRAIAFGIVRISALECWGANFDE